MERLRKTRGFYFIAAVLSGIFVITCEMGLGPTIDLEPPILIVESITLPDGSKHIVQAEDGGKLFIGPGILFNEKESYLEGRARDNKEVTGILVEEIQTNPQTGAIEVINSWNKATIGSPDEQGWQKWSISLHGIRKGERVISITAQDRPKNVGPETVKQLTLLVDTDDPIVQSVTIVRKPGVTVGLLPRAILEGLSPADSSSIDNFQNELFTVRASIVHDFALDEVWLNFLDSDGKEIFPSDGTVDGLRRTGGTVYAPYWDITEKQLTDARDELKTGKHYLNVKITARAKAGHTGEGPGKWEIDETGKKTVILYSLCWYPEADDPHIVMPKAPDTSDDYGNPAYKVFQGGSVPLNVFDDDNLAAMYAAVVSYSDWDAYMPGSSDTEKLESLYDSTNRDTFGREASGTTKLNVNQRGGTGDVRSVVVPVKVGNNHGSYKLIVVAQDSRTLDSRDDITARTPRWGHALFNLDITEIEISVSMAALVCTSPNGSWPSGEELTFKLIFNGPVYNIDAASTYITLNGGTWGVARGGETIVRFPHVDKSDTNELVLEATWTPAPGTVVYNPLIVTDIKLGGVRNADDDTGFDDPGLIYDDPGKEAVFIPNDDPDYAIDLRDWLKRDKLNVFTFAPYVTAIQDVALGTAVNNVAVAPAGGYSTVELTFDRKPVVGNGAITVKPAAGWLAPPVIESEEYARIRGAISANTDSAQAQIYLKTLSDSYAETTHGLKIDGGNYVPDTATKYVLNFTEGLDNAALRPVFEAAQYMWQELESTSVRVRKGTDAADINKIFLDLDPLPIGRQWIIEISEGAFIDEAGNENAAWNSGAADGVNCYFWSQQVAPPVIRVNRVSNNHTGIGLNPARTPMSNYISHPNLRPGNQRGDADEGPTDEITLRVNVQYRIDCETPGAVITSGKLESLFASVTDAGTTNGDNPTYNAPGPFDNATAEPRDATANSLIPDATAAQLGAIPLAGYTSPGTITNINDTGIATIGDTDMYTARKDYIAAMATHGSLDDSERAYEGAFKTVIVYRGKTLPNDKPYLATEGTNVRNGATTISGFPLTNNDFTGRTLKYCYRNGNANADTTDWIWISWEIVSDFWHVGMAMVRNTPNGKFTQGEDPWQPWGYDHYNHNYRKYGNYGIRNRGD